MGKTADPFRYFQSYPDVIRLVVMMYVMHPNFSADTGLPETPKLRACILA